MKKIILLSLTLLAGLFVLSNTTKAADALLDLEITAVTGSCIYGGDLDLNTGGVTYYQSYDAFAATGAFLNTSGTAKWSCNDTAGKVPWSMDIGSTDLVTTVGATYTIANTQIEILASTPTVYQGNPASFTGTAYFQARGTSLSTTQELIKKTSPAGTVGELGVDDVTLRVLVPANQEIGQYQATITIVVPNM